MTSSTESQVKSHFKTKDGILSIYNDTLYGFAKTFISKKWLTDVGTYSTQGDIWFGSIEWQAGEKRADEDLKLGRFWDCETIDEVISILHAQGKEKKRKRKS